VLLVVLLLLLLLQLLGRDNAIMFFKATSSFTGVFTQLTNVWLLPNVGHFM
jgi:hypothetical protein